MGNSARGKLEGQTCTGLFFSINSRMISIAVVVLFSYKELYKMPIVETLFIDTNTHNVIERAHMPVEGLPQNFAVETKLHIAGEDWRVIKADPTTAEEFIQTGKLVITLEKISRVPAGDMLYTLPSICDEIPAILADSTKRGKNVLELREDGWRQIEFVSHSYRGAIDSQLAEIMRIYRAASIDNGGLLAFREIYVRQQLKAPLQEEAINLDQLYTFFNSAIYRYEGLAYQHFEGLIEGGFAFRVATVFLYGQQAEGIVKILGVRVAEDVGGEGKEIADTLQKFMAAYNLYLVDWCNLQVVTADAEMIHNFLME